jgi:hypothetical protein
MCEEFQFGQEFTVDHFNFILISINPIEWWAVTYVVKENYT